MSDWADKKAESILRTTEHTSPALGAVVREVQAIVAAALDEAEQRGAERERWECHQVAYRQAEKYAEAAQASDACLEVRDLIAARGSMSDPDLEPWQYEELSREQANTDLSNQMRGPEEEA